MNTDTNKLMTYLYGEMDEAEREAFGAAIENSEELQRELKELQQMRTLMTEWKDELPQPLPHIHPQQPKLYFSRLSFAAGIAASLILLCVVALLAGTRIHYDSSGFGLIVGDAGQEYVKRSELGAAIEEMKSLANKATAPETKQAVPAVVSTLGTEQTRLLMRLAAEQNRKNMQEIVGAMERQQEKQLDHTMSAFARYFEQQRKSDIRTISSELQNIRSSSDDKFYETDQALNKLFQTVQYAGR